MAILLETKRARFEDIVGNIQEEYGYLHPSETPRRLIGDHIVPPSLYEPIQRKIVRHPTHLTVFPDVVPTGEELLGIGDWITIWTDDSPWRPATAGLHRPLRANLLPSEKRRFSTATQENNKFVLLPPLFFRAQERSMPVVVFDNNKRNLSRAAEVAEAMHISVPLVLARADMYEGADQETYGFNGSYAILAHVPQMVRLRQEIGEPTFWIVDFNDTLHNKPAYEGSIIDVLSGIIFSREDRVYETV